MGSILTKSSVPENERIESYHALAHWILIVYIVGSKYKNMLNLLEKKVCRYPVGVAVLNRGLSAFEAVRALDSDQYSAL
jgi:hypothetical protein